MPERLRLAVRGAVQGVGFRPFLFRLAAERCLAGWCRNSAQGVDIEVEGDRGALESFLAAVHDEPPIRSAIHGLEASWLDPVGLGPFAILESDLSGRPNAVVMPDIAICDACRAELLDPADRRFRYPFINCTNCGPRFTIIEGLPYDRARTSMRGFPMCPACRREYEDPRDRRFHAEPNACPVCGPQVALWDAGGATVGERDAALQLAVQALRAGRIVAVKGLGGFHLVVDAGDDAAVRRLRDRKHREEKPLAVMYPSLTLLQEHAHIGSRERRVLESPEAPILLVDPRDAARPHVAPAVAPGSRQLGVMLPYTPLHLLLLRDFGRPVVATSGNRSDEPICIDEREVRERLDGIADLYLVHDRPIVRHVDDSVARMVQGRSLLLRRSRGYAPWPIPLPAVAPPLVGTGAHMKSTVAITAGAAIVVSQHLGDLETSRAAAAFHAALHSLERLYRVTPEAVAVDLHADYRSTRYGRGLGLPVTAVQHHYAHLAACMADNDLTGPMLGAIWDGSGYGTDATVWGGEFLRTTTTGFERVACLRPFRLPGGEAAVREPRRSALGLLAARGGEALQRWRRLAATGLSAEADRVLVQMADRGLNAPVTSSIGRLFDAVASIAGVRQIARFEGQAAMALEMCVAPGVSDAYPLPLSPPQPEWQMGSWAPPPLVLDWAPLIDALLDDVEAGTPPGVIAARVHHALVQAIVDVAVGLGAPAIALSGGCFQNAYLTEAAITRLTNAGVRPYWHQRLPPNDGAIAAGQIVAWLRQHGADAHMPASAAVAAV